MANGSNPSRRKGALPTPATPGPERLHDREPMLNIAQVAELLCTPERFVRRLVAERRIGFTKVGRYVRFTVTDIEQFTNAGRVDPIDPWATYRTTHRAS
jgi:excisionase family DNA binding protein